jgi:hypothetical protein
MAFFLDVLLAGILLLDGNRIHGPFIAFVLYGHTSDTSCIGRKCGSQWQIGLGARNDQSDRYPNP